MSGGGFEVADGRLYRAGWPLVPTGVNFHPSLAGCEWLRRDPERLAADFETMARHGCNTVRFFVFWRDIEPEPGRIDEVAIGRVRTFAELAADAGLACVPALITIFMNGELLDLGWRAGRDPWTDPFVRGRAVAYVERLAAELAPV